MDPLQVGDWVALKVAVEVRQGRVERIVNDRRVTVRWGVGTGYEGQTSVHDVENSASSDARDWSRWTDDRRDQAQPLKRIVEAMERPPDVERGGPRNPVRS